MKYIRIKNNGEIEPEALHLVGASTKRHDKSKIGQFGSGNKYALAYFLRNNYEIKVFAGKNEIKIDRISRKALGSKYNVITINGEATSITDEMGKDWTIWQAMREIYCNALDEGGCSIDTVDNIVPIDGETHFYLSNTPDAVDFLENFDQYFATNKKVLFECPTGRILEKSGDKANIYRKGIKCMITNKSSLYDYDFNDIEIDENRLVKYFWKTEEKMWDMIYQCDLGDIVKHILKDCGKNEYMEGCISDIASLDGDKISDTFKDVVKNINVVPKSFSKLLKPEEKDSYVVLPTQVFENISDYSEINEFKLSKDVGIYREVEATEEQQQLINETLEFFDEHNIDVIDDIKLAIFGNEYIMGCVSDESIMLSVECLKNYELTIKMILKCSIQIKHGLEEGEALDDAIITEFVEYAKNNQLVAH